MRASVATISIVEADEANKGFIMKGKCANCRKEATLYSYANNLVCTECLDSLADEGNTCPNCGFHSDACDEVSLMLSRPKATDQERAIAKEVPIIVCPKCRILFFDKFTFKILEGLK